VIATNRDEAMTQALELLAPAGDAQIGMAAIDHGADAVYIGAPKYSARAAAGSCAADIKRLISHAHFFHAKVYVALNTILSDREIPEALDIIRQIDELGADGLIIQDVGLLELDLPPIPLIASTQMHNATPEQVKFLEEVGFSRVILARELSIDEMAQIRQKTSTIELEAFVHGALGVSYSGQCYMSQAVTGRSGNRGVCAQPCRSRYALIDGDGKKILDNKYLLSLKDLNRLEAIPDMVSAGITSFKIEGRYKGMSYVKNVTAAYRKAIDAFIDAHPGYRRSSSGQSAFTFSPDVHCTFNRGYTSYFLSGKQEKVASLDTQKSIGQPIGRISAVGKNYFRMTRHDLQNGDGLCFFTKQNDLAGCRVERVDKGRIYPGSMEGLEVGTEIYRNHHTTFERLLKKSEGLRRIGVSFHFVQDDFRITLRAEDEDGMTAETALDVVFEPARDSAKARATLEKHLAGLGGTPYRLAGLNVEAAGIGFLPVRLINRLRREVLEKLSRNRRQAYVRPCLPVVPNNVPYPQKKLDHRANVFNDYARAFYERHGATVVEPAFETLSDVKGKTVMTTRYCIRYELNLCPKHQRPVRPIKEPLRLQDAHSTYRLEFDCRACRMRIIIESSTGRIQTKSIDPEN
jgi:putative protease